MKHYSTFEKYISKKIKRLSWFHYILKYFYQYINYLLYGKKNHIVVNRLCEIKSSPKDSFVGYYDHTPWSDDMKYFLYHTKKNKALHLNLALDFSNFSKSMITIAKQKKFNLQQGIRPIWLNKKEIIFNSIVANKLLASVYNLDNQTIKNYDYPVQEISNTKNIYFSIDYSHLEFLNPDYGYNINKTNIKKVIIDGILGFDYKKEKILFKLCKEKIHSLSFNKNKIESNDCEINHISSSPIENKFIFIYRSNKNKGFSELFIYDYEKNNLKLLFSGSIVSHYCWIDKNNIFIYMGRDTDDQGFYTLNHTTGIFKFLNKELHINGDGHPSISPDREWVVYDSYPDKKRISYLNLYNFKNNSIVNIGEFFSPMNSYGYNRCDLHPRWSPDGKYISIDSVHESVRKTYLIDVSKII